MIHITWAQSWSVFINSWIIIGPIIGWFTNDWLSSRRGNNDRRKKHRSDLRTLRNEFATKDCFFGPGQAFNSWWENAAEDYGRIKKWKIENCLKHINSWRTPLPDLPDGTKTGRTEEEQRRYHNKCMSAKHDLLTLTNKLIKLA